MRRVVRGLSGKQKLFLTDFTELKGCGCKVPKAELLGYLSAIPGTRSRVFSTSPDCHVEHPAPGVTMASTVDFFFPLVDEAYLQGQIAAANVMSDLFAMGITRITSFLVTLGLSTSLTEEQRGFVAGELLRGIENKVEEAGAVVGGGQTVRNPWVLVGGCAMGFLQPGEKLLDNRSAVPGDRLILTKPLGAQLAVNFAQVFRRDPEKSRKLLDTGKITLESFEKSFRKATAAMSRLNLGAAKTIQKHQNWVRGSTDVTGFGLKGHSDNLVELQESPVDFIFDKVPVFEGLKDLDGVVRDFKLRQGLASETSGGLLVIVEGGKEKEFIETLKEFGQEGWVVGKVVPGSRKTVITSDTYFFDA